MADEVARLQYRLEATTARFETQIKRAERAMSRSARRIERDAGSVDARVSRMGTRMATALAGLSTAAVVRGLDNTISSLDEIGKTADRLGLTTDALQELRSAAEQSGVAANTLDMAMQRFGRRVAEARQGAGEAKDALAEMGVALVDADGAARPVEAVLADVADAMASMSDQTDRNRLAMRLFDSEGVALVNMLRNGADGLEAMRDRAREMGAVIEEDSVRAAEALRTEIDLLSDAISTRFTAAIGSMAKAFNDFAGIRGPTEELQALRQELEQLDSDLDDAANVTDWLGRPNEELKAALEERRAIVVAGIERLRAASEAAAAGTTSTTTTTATSSSRSGGAEGSIADEMGAVEARIQALREEKALLKTTGLERERLRAQMGNLAIATDLERRAREEGLEVTTDLLREIFALGDAYEEAAIAVAEEVAAQDAAVEARREAAEATRDVERANEALLSSLSRGIANANSFEDALRRVAVQLAEVAIQGAFGVGPAAGLFGGGLAAVGRGLIAGVSGSSIAGGLGGYASPSLGSAGALYAKGGAFIGGREVVPFARGGVVGAPTLFPMAGGRTGMMGEAGPEAIMPLKRGPGGRLGVEASGGGTIVTNHIDARGATDPAAVEAAVLRGMAAVNAQTPSIVRDMRRRGQI